jgi:hypothetical protein
LRPALRLNQDTPVRIHAGNTDDSGPRGGIKGWRRRPVIADRCYYEVSGGDHALDDTLKHPVWRSHEAHINNGYFLLREPGEGFSHTIRRTSRRQTAIHIRRIKLAPGYGTVERCGPAYQERCDRGGVLLRHDSPGASVMMQRNSTENLVIRIDATIDETDARCANRGRPSGLLLRPSHRRSNNSRRSYSSALNIDMVEVIDTVGNERLQPGK